MLREETERIVTSHIRERESRAKEQVMTTFTGIWAAQEKKKKNTENRKDLKH